jgi:hypothetical protein
MAPVRTVPEGYPPIIREEIDRDNVRDGRRILWFQERQGGLAGLLELRYVKLRGRRTLPPLKFFQTHDVYAVELAANWEKPIGGGMFLRRVALKPKQSNLIFDISFSPTTDEVQYVSKEPPQEHIEARKILKAVGSL